jgi:hypothetical protein
MRSSQRQSAMFVNKEQPAYVFNFIDNVTQVTLCTTHQYIFFLNEIYIYLRNVMLILCLYVCACLYAKGNFGVKKVSAPSKNTAKCPIICCKEPTSTERTFRKSNMGGRLGPTVLKGQSHGMERGAARPFA